MRNQIRAHFDEGVSAGLQVCPCHPISSTLETCSKWSVCTTMELREGFPSDSMPGSHSRQQDLEIFCQTTAVVHDCQSPASLSRRSVCYPSPTEQSGNQKTKTLCQTCYASFPPPTHSARFRDYKAKAAFEKARNRSGSFGGRIAGQSQREKQGSDRAPRV